MDFKLLREYLLVHYWLWIHYLVNRKLGYMNGVVKLCELLPFF